MKLPLKLQKAVYDYAKFCIKNAIKIEPESDHFSIHLNSNTRVNLDVWGYCSLYYVNLTYENNNKLIEKEYFNIFYKIKFMLLIRKLQNPFKRSKRDIITKDILTVIPKQFFNKDFIKKYTVEPEFNQKVNSTLQEHEQLLMELMDKLNETSIR